MLQFGEPVLIYGTGKTTSGEADTPLKKDDLIVITGAGGFNIAGNLALYFKKNGFTNIRAVDKKLLYEWGTFTSPACKNLSMDVSHEDNCHRVCEGAAGKSITWPPTWAEWVSSNRFRVECLRSVLVKHAHGGGRVSSRRAPLFLFQFSLRI